MNGPRVYGFTLLELLVVIALIALLATAAAWSGAYMARGWQLKRAGQQLYEDLKMTQARAENSGSLTWRAGTLVLQRSFLVFTPEQQRYAAYHWVDLNSNSIVEESETSLLSENNLPRGIVFGFIEGVDHRACSNTNSPPGDSISFSSPGFSPCNSQPCIKFDQNGFSVMGPGTIYLSDGDRSLAISGTRPGHFTLCEWDGERWH